MKIQTDSETVEIKTVSRFLPEQSDPDNHRYVFAYTITVTNTGSRDGEEVVQVYLKKNGETDGPIKTLRAFKRVRIPAGKTVKVELELTPKQLEWWDNTTNTMRTMQNTFDVLVGGSSQEKDLQKKTLKLL